MGDINEFFERMLSKVESRKVETVSSPPPIPPMNFRWICFLTNDLKEQHFKVEVLMIDVFDKFMHVVPITITSKREGDVASGMIECLNKMDNKPRIIYTDDEGAWNKEAIHKYLRDENIERHRTKEPNLSERAIRTSKDMLYRS